mgnify:CR=1 FL=1
MRGLTSTLILVLLLAGLGGYIYFVDSKKPEAGPGGETRGKVFSVEADKIEAKLENGVLTVRVAKAEAVKPRSIKVVAK